MGCGSPRSSAQKRSTAASATMPTAAARNIRSPGGMRLPATGASGRRRPMPRPPLLSRPLPPRRAALLTVDVEDWFHVNYRSWVPPPGWDPPRRVVEATRHVLDLLAARGRRGTFFVLASAARSAPGLVRAIAAAGHEVACHGLEHTLLYAADPARVERELREARRLLEGELGAPRAARARPPRLPGARLPPPARARPGAPHPSARAARALHPGGRSGGDAAQARPSPRPPPLGPDPGRVRDRARRRATRGPLSSANASPRAVGACEPVEPPRPLRHRLPQ